MATKKRATTRRATVPTSEVRKLLNEASATVDPLVMLSHAWAAYRLQSADDPTLFVLEALMRANKEGVALDRLTEAARAMLGLNVKSERAVVVRRFVAIARENLAARFDVWVTAAQVASALWDTWALFNLPKRPSSPESPMQTLMASAARAAPTTDAEVVVRRLLKAAGMKDRDAGNAVHSALYSAR